MSEETTRALPRDGAEHILPGLTSLEEKVDGRFSGVESRLSALEEKGDALGEKVDRRLQEARPIRE